ncbi:hypothetical protein X566_11560 [Afipia sp. P52-10]|nr:hypothetical protein X566_11560 [Afipia sp. P52-10]
MVRSGARMISKSAEQFSDRIMLKQTPHLEP